MERIIELKTFGSTKKLTFSHNHAFFNAFNRKIEQLVTAGIINHWTEVFEALVDPKDLIRLKPENYQKMSLKHLEAGFVVWLLSLLFPIAAFIIEWIMTWKDFIIFKYIFKFYMKHLEESCSSRDRKMQTILRRIRNAKQNLRESCEFKFESVSSKPEEMQEKNHLKYISEIKSDFLYPNKMLRNGIEKCEELRVK